MIQERAEGEILSWYITTICMFIMVLDTVVVPTSNCAGIYGTVVVPSAAPSTGSLVC